MLHGRLTFTWPTRPSQTKCCKVQSSHSLLGNAAASLTALSHRNACFDCFKNCHNKEKIEVERGSAAVVFTEAVPGNIRRADHFVGFMKRFVEYLKVQLYHLEAYSMSHPHMCTCEHRYCTCNL